jgi:hypothetical protein
MNIAKATEKYEAWLARHIRLIDQDLQFKHQQMRTATFPFLRATYYRWAQTWAEICGPLARAPRVLAVGDLHVENFGTWRDIEGRLIWGINDFDEAWYLPYPNDLIRLATSALLAEMTCDQQAGVAAILDGYRGALEAGGSPFALAERHSALRTMAVARLHDPEQFWEKLHALPLLEGPIPAGASKAIARMMPERGLEFKVAHRVAGLGSLGRERYVALADWHGGSVAREAKALARETRPSCTRKLWIARCAAATRLCACRSAGSCAAWRRIARALSFPRCPRSATRCACSVRWAGKPPTCTWAAPSPRSCSKTCKNARPAGCFNAPAKW